MLFNIWIQLWVTYHFTMLRIWREWRKDYRRNTATYWEYTHRVAYHRLRVIQLCRQYPDCGASWEWEK